MMNDEGLKHPFGKFVHGLDKHAMNTSNRKRMRVDKKGSDQIYNTLADPELDNDKRREYV